MSMLSVLSVEEVLNYTYLYLYNILLFQVKCAVNPVDLTRIINWPILTSYTSPSVQNTLSFFWYSWRMLWLKRLSCLILVSALQLSASRPNLNVLNFLLFSSRIWKSGPYLGLSVFCFHHKLNFLYTFLFLVNKLLNNVRAAVKSKNKVCNIHETFPIMFIEKELFQSKWVFRGVGEILFTNLVF